MHYFRVEQPGVVTQEGAILVTFWNHGYWYIAYRHREGYAQLNVHQNGGTIGEPSFYGVALPINEGEAMATDPLLFREAFSDYEGHKAYEREALLLTAHQKGGGSRDTTTTTTRTSKKGRNKSHAI